MVLENPDVYTSDSNGSWDGNYGIRRSVCKATIITGNSFLTWLGSDMQQESWVYPIPYNPIPYIAETNYYNPVILIEGLLHRLPSKLP
jgi:hypothetical protein